MRGLQAPNDKAPIAICFYMIVNLSKLDLRIPPIGGLLREVLHGLKAWDGFFGGLLQSLSGGFGLAFGERGSGLGNFFDVVLVFFVRFFQFVADALAFVP